MNFVRTLRRLRSSLLKASSATAVVAGVALGANLAAPAAYAEVARDDVGPTAIRDTGNAWPWVGQMIDWSSAPTLSFGLCTGQAISPRVVLFAAHCIGGAGGSELYGNGGFNMAFMFNPRNLAALRQYVGLDPSTTPVGVSNEANNVYRVIDLIAHPLNLNNAFTAGNADVVMAVLDQPINGFNGYGMLFSPLMALEQVELVGYGNQGTMSSGQISIDWWRRAGDNMIGFLGSDNDIFATDLFGNNPPIAGGWDGDIYWTDSDSHLDPRPAGDFNIFGGAALPNEVGIAQGDSGGAMWIRRNGVPIAIGVASYGYNFGGPLFGHGTMSAHTALFPYWDFIVANNAYVYASAQTGGGAWENPLTWVQMLDPSYLTLDGGGNLVNALPTTDPVSDQGGGPNVGGVRPLPVFPVPNNVSGPAELTGEATDTRGAVTDFSARYTLDGDAAAAASGDGAITHQAASAGAADPAASINLGDARGNPIAAIGGSGSGFWPVGVAPLTGPGSTNFTPDNTDGVIGVAFANQARFFEVQLVNSGVVTLSSAREIDRLRIMSAPAGLTINAAGSLTTIMSSSVEAGTLTVNGLLRARGVGLFGGLLQGTGLIQTSGGVDVLGASPAAGQLAVTGGILAPATIGTVGTLSLEGNAAFASGVFALDVASLVSFDRVSVSGLAGATTGANGTFASSTIGPFPAMAVSWLGGYTPTWGSTYNVVTATGGVTGDFAVFDNLIGVLFPNYTAVGTNGVLSIEATPFVTATTYTSDEQREIARGLDAVRAGGGYGALSNLFGSLDNTALGLLPATFEAMVPLNAFGAIGLTEATTTQITEALEDRRDQVINGGGRGFQTAGLNAIGLGPQLASADPYEAMLMGVSAIVAAQDAAADTAGRMHNMRLRQGWGGFLNISSLVDTSYAITPFAGAADVEAINGTLGFDRTIANGNAFLGAALSFNSGDAALPIPLQSVEADSFGLNIYGGARRGQWYTTGYFGMSFQSYDLSRTVPLLLGAQTLVASPDGDTWSAGGEVGYDYHVGGGSLTPFLGVDGLWMNMDRYTETGGSAALSVAQRAEEIIDGRVGLTWRGAMNMGSGVLRPRIRVAYAADLHGDDNLVSAAFAGFPSVPMTFTGADRDNGWVEYAIGVEYEGPRVGVSLNYTGADNSQLDYGAVAARASVAW